MSFRLRLAGTTMAVLVLLFLASPAGKRDRQLEEAWGAAQRAAHHLEAETRFFLNGIGGGVALASQ